MNELLPEGVLLPEETHFKLETLLRAKFLVEATNLITEVKTPWSSISRSSIPANMMLLENHRKSLSMEKGRLCCCSHPSLQKWLCTPHQVCVSAPAQPLGDAGAVSQDRDPAGGLSPPGAPNVLSSAGPRPPETSQQKQHSMNPIPSHSSPMEYTPSYYTRELFLK